MKPPIPSGNPPGTCERTAATRWATRRHWSRRLRERQRSSSNPWRSEEPNIQTSRKPTTHGGLMRQPPNIQETHKTDSLRPQPHLPERPNPGPDCSPVSRNPEQIAQLLSSVYTRVSLFDAKHQQCSKSPLNQTCPTWVRSHRFYLVRPGGEHRAYFLVQRAFLLVRTKCWCAASPLLWCFHQPSCHHQVCHHCWW